MINLKELINLLPYYFKENDTYKVEGKGILERFLEICGSYFEDNILPDIDNTLDLISFDKTPEHCLNYLWEFLGELPFAFGPVINSEKFKEYYNGLYSKEELDKLKELWTQPKKGPVVLSNNEIRQLLSYAISLNKIRGTKQFFEIMFKLYGFDVTITDPTQAYTKTSTGCFSNYNQNYPDSNKLDIAHFDNPNDTMDINNGCNQCIPINIDVSTTVGFLCIDGHYFRDSQSIIYSGKYDGLSHLTNLTLEELKQLYIQASQSTEKDPSGKVIRYYSTDQDDFIENNQALIITGQLPASVRDFTMFRLMVENFFDRYLPYNVKPTFTYQGLPVDDGIQIYAEYLDPSVTRLDSVVDAVPVKVTIRSNWPRTNFKYRVCSEYTTSGSTYAFKEWGKEHNANDIFYIYSPGVYYFKQADADDPTVASVSSNNKYANLTVYKHVENLSYSIDVVDNDLQDNVEHPGDLLYSRITPYNYYRQKFYHRYVINEAWLNVSGKKTLNTYNWTKGLDGNIIKSGVTNTVTSVPVSCDNADHVSYIVSTGNTTVTLKGKFPIYRKKVQAIYRIYIEEYQSYYKEVTLTTEPLTLSLSVNPTIQKLHNTAVSTLISIPTNYGSLNDIFPDWKAVCLNNNKEYNHNTHFTTLYTGEYSFKPVDMLGSTFEDYTPVKFKVINWVNTQYSLSVNPTGHVNLGSTLTIQLIASGGDDIPNYNVNIYEAGLLVTTINAQDPISYTPTTQGILKVESVIDSSVYTEVEVTPSGQESVKTLLTIQGAATSTPDSVLINWIQENSYEKDIYGCTIARCKLKYHNNDNSGIDATVLGWEVSAVDISTNRYTWRPMYNGEGDLVVIEGGLLSFNYANHRSPSGAWSNIIGPNISEPANMNSTVKGFHTVLAPNGRVAGINDFYLVYGPNFFIRLYENSRLPIEADIPVVKRWYKSGNTWLSEVVPEQPLWVTNNDSLPWHTRTAALEPHYIDEYHAFGTLDNRGSGFVMYEFQYTLSNGTVLRALLYIYDVNYNGNYNERFDVTNGTIIEN